MLHDGNGTMFDDKVSLLLFALHKAFQATPRRLMSSKVYAALFGALVWRYLYFLDSYTSIKIIYGSLIKSSYLYVLFLCKCSFSGGTISIVVLVSVWVICTLVFIILLIMYHCFHYLNVFSYLICSSSSLIIFVVVGSCCHDYTFLCIHLSLCVMLVL